MLLDELCLKIKKKKKTFFFYFREDIVFNADPISSQGNSFFFFPSFSLLLIFLSESFNTSAPCSQFSCNLKKKKELFVLANNVSIEHRLQPAQGINMYISPFINITITISKKKKSGSNKLRRVQKKEIVKSNLNDSSEKKKTEVGPHVMLGIDVSKKSKKKKRNVAIQRK